MCECWVCYELRIGSFIYWLSDMSVNDLFPYSPMLPPPHLSPSGPSEPVQFIRPWLDHFLSFFHFS